jgi:hypothetical protein
MAGGNSKGEEGNRQEGGLGSDTQRSWANVEVDTHDEREVEDILVARRLVEQWPDCRDLMVATGLLTAAVAVVADLEVSPGYASIEPVALQREPISEG